MLEMNTHHQRSRLQSECVINKFMSVNTCMYVMLYSMSLGGGRSTSLNAAVTAAINKVITCHSILCLSL